MVLLGLKSRVTSRRLTVSRLASTTIYMPFCLKVLKTSFF